MNDSQAPVSGINLEQQVDALQRQVFLLLVALIVVTSTVVFYLFYESHVESVDLMEYRPAAVQKIELYNNNALKIQNFYKELAEYGIAHPGFEQAVLAKYGLVPRGQGQTTEPIH
jgi:hypothetical protein